MATAPRPGIGKRVEAEEAKITIAVNGKTYTLRPAEMSARDSAALRKETGVSVRAILSAASSDPDLDVIAAIVWLARRQHGETDVTYDEVASEITYASTIDSEAVGDDDEDDSPEA